MKKIAITGHRNLIEPKEVRKNIAMSLAYFKDKYTQLEALSAVAVGADTIFVEEAQKQDIPTRYFLPFQLEIYQEDFDETQLDTLNKLLDGQDFEVVAPLKTIDPNERNDAYMAVGKRLVDEADIVLAVWDEQPAAGKGGTGDVVAYARTQGKEVHIIRGLRAKSKQEADEVLFDKLDTDAVRYKEKFFQPFWYLGLAFAIAGVVFFAIGLAFHLDFKTAESKLSLAGWEVFCILISAILIVILARRYKNRFLHDRRNAEFLRTLQWFQQANIPLPLVSEEEIYANKKPKHQPIAILPASTAFEQTLAERKPNQASFEDAKRKLWVFAQDQIDYHEKTRLKPLKTKDKIIHKVLNVLKWVFYASLSLKVLIEIQHFCHEKHWHLPHLPIDSLLPYCNLLLIVVPSVFAVLETVRSFEEWERNQHEAEKMKGKLARIQDEIFEAQEEATLQNASKNLRFVLEKENCEWADRVASLTPGVHI
jgi:hypothetical protein